MADFSDNEDVKSIESKSTDLDQTVSNPVVQMIKSASNKLHLHSVHATGAAKGFNPTKIHMQVTLHDENASEHSQKHHHAHIPDMAIIWRSRDNRKRRTTIAVPRSSTWKDSAAHHGLHGRPESTKSLGSVAKGILRMFITFPFWDMAWHVAFWFTIGSIIWVINGFFCWLPVAFPSTEFNGESKYGVGLTSFVGVVAFQIGATLAYLEGVNDGSFHGSAMNRIIGSDENAIKGLVDDKLHHFAHKLVPRRWGHDKEIVNPNEPAGRDHKAINPKSQLTPHRRQAVDFGVDEKDTHDYTEFRWLPTWHNLKHHHVREIGFLAVTIQFIGASIFIIDGIGALPGIMQAMNHWQLTAFFYVPQMIASIFFTVASAMFMLETQEKWYKPAPGVLGWWVGFWATAGSVGFEVCACLGVVYNSSQAEYQSLLASLWGSICFLISSVLQLYESVNKHSVEELFVEPGDLKSFQIRAV